MVHHIYIVVGCVVYVPRCDFVELLIEKLGKEVVYLAVQEYLELEGGHTKVLYFGFGFM